MLWHCDDDVGGRDGDSGNSGGNHYSHDDGGDVNCNGDYSDNVVMVVIMTMMMCRVSAMMMAVTMAVTMAMMKAMIMMMIKRRMGQQDS